MPTQKLFYEDSHLSVFSACVLSCEEGKNGWLVTLDATAFYPEGGGQPGDTGILGSVRVLDTHQKDGIVLHLCDGPLEVGSTVEGTIDFGPRFQRMQQHSGEHIVSGILHRRYGCHNTGFHMGGDGIVTVDFDTAFPESALPEIEAEANGAVWQDLPVRCWYPDPEVLPTVPYRTKKALPWPVRLVEIPGFDTCACCGTHVQRTGEIGLIKLLSLVNFRGGVRMEMACGGAALAILNQAYTQNRLVCAAFSAKPGETGLAARRMNEQLEQEKFYAVGLRRRLFQHLAEQCRGKGNVLRFEDGLDAGAVRELAEQIGAVCGGTAAVLSGSPEEGFFFCLADEKRDLRPLCRELTQRFSGRGGGKPHFQQGKLTGDREQIAAFFDGTLSPEIMLL